MAAEQIPDFQAAFFGRFSGVLRWTQFETLWQAIAANADGWYVYEPEEGAPPIEAMPADEMLAFLDEAKIYLRENCMRDCCGAVYADSFEAPSFIKVYNPRLMGGCGMGKAPLPHWVISRIKPVSLLESEPSEDKDESLFGRLFHNYS